VVGNPPFSAKYGRISDKNILDRYELGRGRRSQAVEVLFLERFIRLARSGGVVGIIIPDGILANTNYEYVTKIHNASLPNTSSYIASKRSIQRQSIHKL